MLACAAVLISWLTVYLPVDFFPTATTIEDVTPVAGPPGLPPVRVHHSTLNGPNGAAIDVTVFDGDPPYPGGPMVVADAEQVVVNDEPVAVNWTSMFMGTAQEVAVVYPVDPAGVGTAMVVLRGMTFVEALDMVPLLLGGCDG